MRISDWSSDVCSFRSQITVQLLWVKAYQSDSRGGARRRRATTCCHSRSSRGPKLTVGASSVASIRLGRRRQTEHRICSIIRSEEHTSELQSLMRISYAVFCLKKKNTQHE